MYYNIDLSGGGNLSGGGHACTCDVDPSCCDKKAFGLGFFKDEKTTTTVLAIGGLIGALVLARSMWATP